MDKNLLSLLKQKRQIAYDNPYSVLKKYNEFLETKGIYFSFNRNIFQKNIKGRIDLCNGILNLYNEAQLENEKIILLEDLTIAGYDKNKLVELILEVFYFEPRPSNLWEYADLLYSIKNYYYMSQYMQIIKDESYGESRQMLILLVGKSKERSIIPVLIDLLNDATVYGHALDALSNFSGREITTIMHKYVQSDVAWIREIAIGFLKGKTGDGSVS